jgi:hypothetical protein
LRKDQVEKLAAELKPLEGALQIARKLKDQPLGRFKIVYSEDFLSTLVPDLYKTVDVGNLLNLKASLFLHRKEKENAWNLNRALLNVGRAVGDEPLLLSTFRRMASAEFCVRSLERALAQGEFLAPQLEERQSALDEELAAPHILIGMRGERAGMNHMLSNIESGKMPLLQTLDKLGSKNQTYKSGPWDHIQDFFAFSLIVRSHANLLDMQTRTIEALNLTLKKRNETLQEIDMGLKKITGKDKSQMLIGLFFPNVGKVAQFENRVHSNLACAIAALGAERFRLQKNRWPESLEEIVQAGCLKKVPIDQFDGNPLRFRRTKDGLVIYSIGPEGNYDGKALDDLRNINQAVVRVEFRLWNAAQRHQPPLPLPVGKR